MFRPARAALLLTTAALMASLTQPAAAYLRRDESWGKPGISYLQYRTDAVECAYQVETKAPVSIPIVDLTFAIDVPTYDTADVLDYASAYGMKTNRHWRRVSQQLEPALVSCLKGRGYQRFRLTDRQKDELKRLGAGTRARNVYLWNLAVDPTVLKTQAR